MIPPGIPIKKLKWHVQSFISPTKYLSNEIYTFLPPYINTQAFLLIDRLWNLMEGFDGWSFFILIVEYHDKNHYYLKLDFLLID